MNRTNGSAIGDLDHLRQSVSDILTTPIGSRVMRRDYGSQLMELIDQPFNGTTKLRAYAAIAMGLMRWEPRLSISRVQISQGSSAYQAIIDLEGTRIDTNQAINLQVPLVMGAIA
ncbi:GPW/gp25 family protein [Pseudomonas sp.]|uniref:GPW/gp25 family protein n=1 Tax=Pseudomonas sp. TaxID=306 RepID=UPI00257E78EE|nr:GPW/gp25 family protein [Pseudomonas sp.]